MARTLRLGLIMEPTGWHNRGFIEALKHPEVGEAAVCDPTGGLIEAARQGGGDKVRAAYTSYDALFREFAPDAVLVTMEPWRQPEPMRRALEAGAHLYYEKPGYVAIDDFRALYRLARRQNRQLYCAYASRMYPVVQEARRLIAAGYLGELLACQAWLVADHERTWQTNPTRIEYDLKRGGWFFSKEKAGGGILTIEGCHYLDILRWISGVNFKSVAAMARVVGGEPITAEDAAGLVVEFEGGMLGTLNCGFYVSSAEYRTLEHLGVMVWGRQGWLRFNPSGKPPFEALEWYSTRATHAKSPTKRWRFEETPGAVGVYQLLFQAFFRACLGLEAPPVQAEDAMWVNECIHAAYVASDTSCTQPIAIPSV
ncbi:MAG: Gfo/Idh/MocA family oxidoreductase [Actinobacteria bacterium]|nr:Gfo/Idh/MocA family oxidoreductase [Actinomycetota bacterium]